MDIWQLIIKPAELIFGIALLYFRFCLYETEEGHLQNSLIDLWIRISDKSDSARKRFERLLEESARVYATRRARQLTLPSVLSRSNAFVPGHRRIAKSLFSRA
jgi:hypothetical protein